MPNVYQKKNHTILISNTDLPSMKCYDDTAALSVYSYGLLVKVIHDK